MITLSLTLEAHFKSSLKSEVNTAYITVYIVESEPSLYRIEGLYRGRGRCEGLGRENYCITAIYVTLFLTSYAAYS